MSTDPLQEKYPNVSTYAYCFQNPVKYIDPDGKDGYLIVFASGGEGGWGHVMFAIDNYTKQLLFDENGSPIITETGFQAYEFVPDGTVTVYDLNPGVTVGIDDALSDVPGVYRASKPMKLDDVRYDGKEPTGILQFSTNMSTDIWIKSRLDKYEKENEKYNGKSNNCSTYTKIGEEASLGGMKLNAEEHTLGMEYTTPNKLYRVAKDSRHYMGGTNVSEYKQAGKAINNNFLAVSKSSNKGEDDKKEN